MKTKIYNNLIFSLFFVCSFCGVFYGVGLFAQDEGERPPTSLNTEEYQQKAKDPLTLHLYSSIFGEQKEIKTSTSDRESVSRMIQGIFGRFFSIIFALSGILMVVLLAAQGTRMIYAEFGGNVAVFSDAKNKVKAVAIGTGILLLSWVILNFVAPSLLRPRLFETITQLGEVGQGFDLISSDLGIPKDGVLFDEDNATVTISRCPEIKKDAFKQQVESVKASLGGKLQYSYQIIYSTVGNNTVTFYDKGDGVGGGIVCTPPNQIEQSFKKIQLPLSVNTVVVFPVVSILKEEVKQLAGGKSKEDVQVKKLWRGKPLKEKVDFDRDAIARRAFASDSFSVKFTDNPLTAHSLSVRVSSNIDNLFALFDIKKDEYKLSSITYDFRGRGHRTSGLFEYARAIQKDDECYGTVLPESTTKTICAKDASKGFSITPVLELRKNNAAPTDLNDTHRGQTVCYDFVRSANSEIVGAIQTDC